METTLNSKIEDPLNLALRMAAGQASASSNTSAVLLYSHVDADPESGRLRAAAGFRSPDDARLLAASLESVVHDVIDSAQTCQSQTKDGREATAFPLMARGRVVGVIAIASATSLTNEMTQAIETIVWSTAIAIDHSNLSAHYEELAQASEKHLEIADEKSDELLKLSEELFAQDIELLRNNEKLGKIEKLKNDFIEKMSRELRTPLNSIIESTITVLSSEHENLSIESQQTLRKALDEGTAFQRTLQNILDLWRVKQNEFPIEIQEVCISDVIDETIFSVQDALQGKSVEIEKEIPDFIPKLRTDLTKVNQILFLLLDNATKFTEAGKITIGARYRDDRLQCWIEDTGIGICPDDQKYIWNEFYQVDDRASIRYRGAGLGLTLVHDLLVLLNGDSMLASEPGKGTRVDFSLPVVLA
jgi:signal transduction histidine kinase